MYYGEVTWFGIIVFFIIVAIERRRKRKAEEERKKEVDRLFKEESERVSEILKNSLTEKRKVVCLQQERRAKQCIGLS